MRERKMRTERESGILGPFFLGIKREKVSSVSESEREREQYFKKFFLGFNRERIFCMREKSEEGESSFSGRLFSGI